MKEESVGIVQSRSQLILGADESFPARLEAKSEPTDRHLQSQVPDRIKPRSSGLDQVSRRAGYDAAQALFSDAARALTHSLTNAELKARYDQLLNHIYFPPSESRRLAVTPGKHFLVDQNAQLASRSALRLLAQSAPTFSLVKSRYESSPSSELVRRNLPRVPLLQWHPQTDDGAQLDKQNDENFAAPVQQPPVEQAEHSKEPVQPASENDAVVKENAPPEHPPVHQPVATPIDESKVLETPPTKVSDVSKSPYRAPEEPIYRGFFRAPTPTLHEVSEHRFPPHQPSSTIREIADPVTAIVSKALLPAAQSRPAAMAKPVTQPTSKIAGLPQPKQLPSASEPVVDTAVAAEQPTVAAETAVVILATTGVIALTVASIVGLLALHRPKLSSPAAVNTHERQALLSKEYKINDPWDGISHPGALLVAC